MGASIVGRCGLRLLKPTVVVTSVEPETHSRRTRVRWVDNGLEIQGDNPVAHGGTGTGPDGFDLLAAALGQCMLNTLMSLFERERVAVRHAHAEVSLKVRRAGRTAPRISDFHVDIHADAELAPEERARFERTVVDQCGVRATLSTPPGLSERLHTGALVAPLP